MLKIFTLSVLFATASYAPSSAFAQGSIPEKAALTLSVCVVAFKDFVKINPNSSREDSNLQTAKTILNSYQKPDIGAAAHLAHIDKYQAQAAKDPGRVSAVAQSCNRYVETFLE